MDKRIEKYFSNELNIDERIELMQELRMNESLRKDFTEYKNTLSLLSFMDYPDDIANGQNSYDEFIIDKQQKKRKRLWLNTLKYSAAIALIILCTLFANNLIKDFSDNPIVAYNTITVPAGQRVSIILSDGTEVWLNAKSTLTYPSSFESKNREVTLMGEAFFNVTKNEKQPFIVSTPALDVRVLGTTFNVNTYKNQESTYVALLEGSVEIEFSDRSEKVTLQPKEKISYGNGIINIEKITSENDYLWHKGIYNFEKAPLEEIVKKLELYYDVKIEIKNQKLLAKQYTGKFRQEDGPAEILRIIQKIHKFKIKDKKETNLFIIE
ncbi:FecR family protein [Prevotella sp. 10(H)]|uniref:FecR family protein n=1 Tax=Prevotella sp. 10(H) TaxID=1158294 RepID=UPI0004A750A8|nr:FecR family protein [Prevotella sp. 10(H)]